MITGKTGLMVPLLPQRAGARTLMGVTNPAEASPGNIRGDYATVITFNIVHGSDGPESAERELGIFFG